MPASEARIRANRENAKLSTGPKSPEGKAVSRRNALKHGLTGQGVALPSEDQAEITRLFAALQKDLRPSNDLSEKLVRRAAFLSVRLERCEKHDTAQASERVRHAVARFDDELLVAIEAQGACLHADPVNTVRRLQATPQGIDWLLKEWAMLRGDLLNENPARWTQNHRAHFDALLGLNPCGYRVARVKILADAKEGLFHYLDKSDGEGLEGPARADWAKAELTRLLDAEVARLNDVRADLDHEGLAADRAEAVDRALFDPSKEATLARKYEAATERALYKALKEFRQAEAEAAEGRDSGITVDTEETCDPLALNSEETPEETPEAEPGPSPAPPMAEPVGISAIERATEGPNPVETARLEAA